MRKELSLEKRSKYGYDIIDVRGEITFDSFDKIEDFIRKEISGENNFAILNLIEVPFINSAAISSMVKIMKELSLLKVDLFLMNANETVEGILKATGMKQYFRFIKDEETLMQKLKNRAVDDMLNDI